MMMNDKRDLRPVLFKFGVALAFSVGGILYTFLKTKKNKPPRSPSSEHQSQADSAKEKAEQKNEDDVHAVPRTPIYCRLDKNAPDKDEPLFLPNSSSEGLVCNFSPSKRSSGEKDGYLLPEFNDLVKDFDFVPRRTSYSSPRKDAEVAEREQDQEIKKLRDTVSTLTERERSLEIQLLEYYGLKEQETAVMELQNRLKINNMEAKLFNLKIESLQADKKRLEQQVADYAKVVSDLEAARAKIKLLRRKLKSEAEQNREQILALKERVAKVQEQEKKALSTDSDIQLKLEKLKDLEVELKELKESNESLREENCSLSQKLDYLQAIATSMIDDEETQALREESNRLRIQNEDLAKEMEQLQAARCTDVEELVYLRWINACLRYELRNFQAGPGKTTARDLSKSLSPKSEEKAKRLIVEYAHKEGSADKGADVPDFDSDRWSSSQASNFTDTGENDDSSIDVPTTNKTSTSTKKLFGKLMNILRGKGSRRLKRSSSLDLLPLPPTEDRPGLSSSRCSAGASPSVNEGFNARSRNSLHNSSRRSLDLPRSPYMQGSGSYRAEESMNSDRKSYDGSSFMYKVMNTSSDGENQPHQDSRDEAHKTELGKYADALRDSRRKPSFRKRSSSVTSF